MRLDWKVLGSAMAGFLSISYMLCVVYDLLLGARMYRAWVDLLPGFHWISWTSFALGLLETIGYGIFFGLVFAPLYNFFLVKVWKHEDQLTLAGQHSGTTTRPVAGRGRL